MPSTSRTVAQQKPTWPFAANLPASAVHFQAFTCGRNVVPGHAALIVATLCSNAPRSTTSAGVGRSPTFIPRTLTPASFENENDPRRADLVLKAQGGGVGRPGRRRCGGWRR